MKETFICGLEYKQSFLTSFLKHVVASQEETFERKANSTLNNGCDIFKEVEVEGEREEMTSIM